MYKDEIILTAQHLYNKNMLAAADGNISYRINSTQILITPAGVSKRLLKHEDIAIININNEVLLGNPSSERLMHLAIYKHCPKARAVIHAHPPKAIAWSIAHPDATEIPANCLSELILAAGGVPIAPYARPGTIDMGEVLMPYLPDRRIILLARHGALTWGEDLNEALNGMERLEHTVEILTYAKILGGLTELPEKEIKVLHDMRKTI